MNQIHYLNEVKNRFGNYFSKLDLDVKILIIKIFSGKIENTRYSQLNCQIYKL